MTYPRNWAHALRSIAAACAAALACFVAPVACDSTNDDDFQQTVADCSALFRETDAPEVSVSSRENDLTILITGPAGSRYSVTVVTGGSWCKTSRIQGTTVAEGTISAGQKATSYLYTLTNPDTAEREAVTEVLFDSGEAFRLTVIQAAAPKPGEKERVLANKRWAELPICTEDDETTVVTHFANLSSEKRARNYTLHYDHNKRIADWVAYPIHGCYMQGSYNRSEAWGYDPALPVNDQANLAIGSYSGFGVRGHQCMSNHRYVAYRENPNQKYSELNAQTFYASNIMPQDYNFNSGLWNKMESVCTHQSCSDTLYCVTGNFGVKGYSTDKNGLEIAIPTYCFKVLLRTVAGNSGEKIHEIREASKLRAIGYYAPNSTEGNKGQLKDYCVPVSKIEELTGYTFFANLDPSIADAVKSQCEPAKWGI